MIKSDKKRESEANITSLRDICTKECTHRQAANLKKYYMNKYGSYMASRIVSVILIELVTMLFILNTNIDSMWQGIPYGESIVYGILWGSGGLYLAQMLIRVVYNTYYLKLALDNGDVKVNAYDVTFHKFATYNNSKKDALYMNIKKNGKNELIWLFTHKSKNRKTTLTYNVNTCESPGTKLMIYSVNDKKHDLFIMVKDRPIEDSVDKVLTNTLSRQVAMSQAQLKVAKKNAKKKRNKK